MAKRNGGIIGPSNVPTGQYGGVAPGVWRLRDAFNYIKAGLWPAIGNYPVGNSLRFNSGSSDSLKRTPSSSGTTTTFTMSFWYKTTVVNTEDNYLYEGYSSNANRSFIRVSSNQLIVNFVSNADNTTAQVFRDPSAWYHILVAFDSTQATSTNRLKIYINGSLATLATANYPTQNVTTYINANVIQRIMSSNYNGGIYSPANGYLAEYYMIDGQQLTPSSFGETDTDTGIWKPKAYTGTYGTNGFYLKFANSASLGTDSSGNGNTFTVDNLTSVDQSTDTPTNNFATWNPLPQWGSGIVTPTLSEGNLQQSVGGASSWATQISTIGVDTGKWYGEFKCSAVGGSNYATLGVTSFTGGGSGSAQSTFSGVWYNANGEKWIDGSNTAYGATYTTGDIIGIALDKTNNTVIFYKNGSSQGSISLPSSITSSTVFIGTSIIFSTTIQGNFGSPFYSANSYTDGAGYGNFSYAVPSGYYALCTANLNTYG